MSPNILDCKWTTFVYVECVPGWLYIVSRNNQFWPKNILNNFVNSRWLYQTIPMCVTTMTQFLHTYLYIQHPTRMTDVHQLFSQSHSPDNVYGQSANPNKELRCTMSLDMVKALRDKPEGRWFDFRWGHWNSLLPQSLWPHDGLGVDSTSNRNEY
jgi:hypothetical protein